MIRIIGNSLRPNGFIRIEQLSRQLSTIASADEQKLWDTYVGILVERTPLITKELTPLEVEYQVISIQSNDQLFPFITYRSNFFQQFLEQIEYEKSHFSNFEVRHNQDVKIAEKMKKNKDRVNLDEVAARTAQDDLDTWKAELDKFQYGSRLTPDDKNNNVKSVNRKLDSNLVLLMEQQFGNRRMLLPQGKVNDGETLRGAAERVVQEICGQSLTVQFEGNAPCGFYKYSYAKGLNLSAYGGKVFFMRATYVAGNVDKKFGEFEWLDKDDIYKKLHSVKNYLRKVKPLLL